MEHVESLSLVRHAESRYGEFSRRKKNIPGFAELTQLVDEGIKDPEFASKIEDKTWPTANVVTVAREVHAQMQKVLNVSDADTSLTEFGKVQAVRAGARLRDALPLPDTIFISPYLRTRQTFELLSKEWTDLKQIATVETADIREQDHGLSAYYKDWRVLFALHPQEAVRFAQEGRYDYRHLEGENVHDLRERSGRFLSRLESEHAGEDVLAITHDRTILAIRSLLQGWDTTSHEQHMRTSTPKETSATRFVRDGQALSFDGIVEENEVLVEA